MSELLSSDQVLSSIDALAESIHRTHAEFDNTVIVGIQQGGVLVSKYLSAALKSNFKYNSIPLGELDITFYRDDFRKQVLAPDRMHLPFDIENKTVILVDDVLFTGRTIKAALDALLDYGRPAKVELCVLVDRKEHRQFPIQPDYVGNSMTTKKTDKVKLVVEGEKPKVVLISQ
jgi:pyrimidine operon attenuation protein/uracil phosphoribosyltransferase